MKFLKKNKPSFFIVGAPKSGTTALSKYLSDHEDIFFSKPKETNYFATDFNLKMRHVSRFSNYLLLFKSAKKNQLCGEGSIWYLYSSKAIKNIYSFNPKSKIIIMLRNPGEMVYSLHYQKIFSLDENIKNFNDAWKASWLREKNKCVPKNCREKKTLFYHKVADYHKQLMNVYKYFPKKQVKIILYDEFKKNNFKI